MLVMTESNATESNATQIGKAFFFLMMTMIIKGNVIAAHCEELLLIISHFLQRC